MERDCLLCRPDEELAPAEVAYYAHPVAVELKNHFVFANSLVVPTHHTVDLTSCEMGTGIARRRELGGSHAARASFIITWQCAVRYLLIALRKRSGLICGW